MFLYTSCYIAEIWITFPTVRGEGGGKIKNSISLSKKKKDNIISVETSTYILQRGLILYCIHAFLNCLCILKLTFFTSEDNFSLLSQLIIFFLTLHMGLGFKMVTLKESLKIQLFYFIKAIKS